MRSIERLGAYLGVFLLIVVLIGLADLGRPLDYVLFKAFQLNRDIDLEDDMVLIDVPYVADGSRAFDREDFRLRIADLLNAIDQRSASGDRPRAVIMDIFFRSDAAGLPAVVSAVTALKRDRIRVYAVLNSMNMAGSTFEQREAMHATALYDLLDGGYLHTQFDQRFGIISYRSKLELQTESGSIRSIRALPLRVAMDLNQVDEPEAPREYALPVGKKAEIASQTYRFVNAAGSTTGGKFYRGDEEVLPPWKNDSVILISSTEGDVEVQGQAGPELVAWAIDDQRNSNRNAKQPVNEPWIIVGLVVFFSLWTALVFAVLLKYVKALQTKPSVIAILSMLIGVLLLAGVSAVFLSGNSVLPVGLTLLAMAVAAVLAWHFAHRFLVTGVAEGSGKWDVFISYSRKDGDWVLHNLYEPLRAMRKADGTELSIFFDRAEIGIGEAFTAKYMWAIVDAQHFIPVFTKNYYGPRSHGRNEMDLAYKRFVEKKIKILPVAQSDDAVPEIYSGLSYVNVSAETGFIEGFRRQILADTDGSGEHGEPVT